MRRIVFLMAVSIVLHGFAFPQNGETLKIKVGDPAMKGESLQPYTNQWHVSLRTPAGKEIPDAATWHDELKPLTVNGVDCLQRTQNATFHKDGKIVGSTQTINVFERKTLAPVSRSFTRHAAAAGQEEQTQVEFHGLSVQVKQSVNGKNTDKTVAIREPVFDFYGGMYGILFAALPLRSGLRAEFPSINEFDPTIAEVTFAVTGKDRVEAGRKGQVDVWVVESDTDQGPMKFWISQDAPYIIRLEFTDKTNSMKWSYSMI